MIAVPVYSALSASIDTVRKTCRRDNHAPPLPSPRAAGISSSEQQHGGQRDAGISST
jgi:hypothetical protein